VVKGGSPRAPPAGAGPR